MPEVNNGQFSNILLLSKYDYGIYNTLYIYLRWLFMEMYDNVSHCALTLDKNFIS